MARIRPQSWRVADVLLLLAWVPAGGALPAEAADAAEAQTEIGRLAARMQPGEVRELVTGNCNHHLFRTWYDWEEDDIKRYGSQKMFDIICWNNDMKWDPVSRQVLVLNGGHYASFKFITYSAAANAWRLMPVPPWMDPRRPDAPACGNDGKGGNRSWPRTHFYDKLAVSPKHRLFAVNMDGLYLYHIDKREWSSRVPTSSGGKDAFQVIEYSPEMNAFVYECNWGRDLRLWDVRKKEERRLGSYPFGIHGVMEYDPVHKVIVFGAGDAGGGQETAGPNLYRLDGNGDVTRLKAPPVHVNCTPTSKFMCDPASGEYVVKGLRDQNVYAFHPLRDEWRKVAGVRLPDGESLGCAIDSYGVMMLLVRTGGREFRCYLYKHRPVFGAGGRARADAGERATAAGRFFDGDRAAAVAGSASKARSPIRAVGPSSSRPQPRRIRRARYGLSRMGRRVRSPAARAFASGYRRLQGPMPCFQPTSAGS